MSDDELIAAHDAKVPSTAVGLSYYLDELARREAMRSAARIKRMTDSVRRLTWVITVLTALSVIAAAVAVMAN